MPGPLYPIQAPSHDDNGKFPWWVRAISVFGIPAVVAVYLIWFLTTSVETRMSSIQESLRLHQLDAQYMLKADEAQRTQWAAMFRLMQQICVNTARTAEDRATCWNPWR